MYLMVYRLNGVHRVFHGQIIGEVKARAICALPLNLLGISTEYSTEAKGKCRDVTVCLRWAVSKDKLISFWLTSQTQLFRYFGIIFGFMRSSYRLKDFVFESVVSHP